MFYGVQLWKTPGQQRRVCLTIHCDSVAMLTLVVNMRPHTRQHRVIAEELANEHAEFPFVPVVAPNLPGVDKTMDDTLSRMSQLFSCVTLPSY